MVGAGDAYYQGVRMKAAQALKNAGLTPIQPFAADDNALTSGNAYATGQAALLVHDAKEALEGGFDLCDRLERHEQQHHALSLVVQRDRPNKLNWHAARVLDMIKGSYVFEKDVKRIIQDPESLRARPSVGPQPGRMGGAARRGGLSSQLIRSQSGRQCGLESAGFMGTGDAAAAALLRQGRAAQPRPARLHRVQCHWDPYPMANRVESFVVALGNMDIAVMLRIERSGIPSSPAPWLRRCCRGPRTASSATHPWICNRKFKAMNPVTLRQRHRGHGRGSAIANAHQAGGRGRRSRRRSIC